MVIQTPALPRLLLCKTSCTVANCLPCGGFHLRGNLRSEVDLMMASDRPVKPYVLQGEGSIPSPCISAHTSSTASPGSWGWAQRGPAAWEGSLLLRLQLGNLLTCPSAARLLLSSSRKPRCRQTATKLDFLLHNSVQT